MSCKKVKVIELERAQSFLSHLATSYFNSANKTENSPQLKALKREFMSSGDLCVTIARELQGLSTEITTGEQ